VAVLADSSKRHVDRRSRDRFTYALTLRTGISRAIQQPCASDSHPRQYSFANVVLKTRRMVPGKPNVLVQMK